MRTNAIYPAIIAALWVLSNPAHSTTESQVKMPMQNAPGLRVLLDITSQWLDANGYAALSQDGSKAAYVATRNDAHQEGNGIHVVDLETGEDQLILKNVDGLDRFSNVSFTPGGEGLLFAVAGDTDYYPGYICTTDLDGKKVTKLVEGQPIHRYPDDTGSAETAYTVMRPAYSPDGRNILLTVMADNGQQYIGIVSAEPGRKQAQPMRLTEKKGALLFFGPDGQSLYHSDAAHIYRFDLVTHEDQTVMNVSAALASGAQGARAVERPDGGGTAYFSTGGRVDIDGLFVGNIPGTEAVLTKDGGIVNLNTAYRGFSSLSNLDFMEAVKKIPPRDVDGRQLTSIGASLSSRRIVVTYHRDIFAAVLADDTSCVNSSQKRCDSQHAQVIEY